MIIAALAALIMLGFLSTKLIQAQTAEEIYLPIVKNGVELPYAPGEVIVKLEPIVSASSIHKDFKSYALKNWGIQIDQITALSQTTSEDSSKTDSELDLYYLLKVSEDADIELISQFLIEDPDIDFALPNYKLRILYPSPKMTDALSESRDIRKRVLSIDCKTQFPKVKPCPNDPHFPEQWGLRNDSGANLQVEDAWDMTTGSSEITVAILDSGVDSQHDDLKENLVSGWNTIDNSSNTIDELWHGTAAAGVIGAQSDNRKGVAGIAWHVKIMPIKVCRYIECKLFDVIEGVKWASDSSQKVHIINMSLGFSLETNSEFGAINNDYFSNAFQDAINYAHDKGVTVVVAAGNNSELLDPLDDTYNLPAELNDVIVVGAVNREDHRCGAFNCGEWGGETPGSGRGPALDVMAPGSLDIWTTDITGAAGENKNGDYTSNFGGTSAAAPFVSGVVALMLSVNPNLTPSQVEDILKKTAFNLGSPGREDAYGFGRIDAYAAVVNAYAQPLSIPELVQPASGTPNLDIQLNFSWKPVQGAEQYEIEISNSSSFVGETIIEFSTATSLQSSLSYNTTYYWRVRAQDGFKFSEWSNIWSFTTGGVGPSPTSIPPDGAKPLPPVLLQPASGSTWGSNSVTLKWQASPSAGVDVYTVRVSTDPSKIDNDPNYVFDGGVDAPITEKTLDLPDGTYYWAVWACNGCKIGKTNYSDRAGPWKVTIDSSTPPGPPADAWYIDYYNDLSDTGPDDGSICHRETTNASPYVFKDWGESSPGGSCNQDFVARIYRHIHLKAGRYNFALFADDNARFELLHAPGGNIIVDQWTKTEHYESRDLPEGDYEFVITFRDNAGRAIVNAWWDGPDFPAFPHDAQDANQWFAAYWPSSDQWQDAVITRNEGGSVPFIKEWGGDGPGYGLPEDHFSTKFVRTVELTCGKYHFEFFADDYAELRILRANDQQIIGQFSGSNQQTAQYDLEYGRYTIEVKHREDTGGATLTILWRQESQCLPDTPTNLTFSTPNNTQVRLNWSHSGNNVNGFRIYRNGMAVNTVSAGSRTYLDTGISCNTNYTYHVVAYQGSIESSPSNEVSIWTQCLPAPVLAMPSQETVVNSSRPNFDWQPVYGANEYALEVDNNNDFSHPEINILTANSDYTVNSTNSPLVDGIYYWRVRARGNGGAWSTWSSVWKFTVDTAPPLAQVYFGSSNFTTGEGSGSASILVKLNSPSEQTVTVNYDISNQTATAGSDYIVNNGSLTFNPGQTSKSFIVSILEDTDDEPDETVNLTLRNPTNATLSSPSTATLTIVDNDEPVPSCNTITEIPRSECEVLEVFYTSTNAHVALDDWFTTHTPCVNWIGIVCTTGHITQLNLDDWAIAGNIPPELGRLSYLERLDLSDNNDLIGPIPPELGDLTRLTVLRLWGNPLSGSVPSELGNLVNLRELGLYWSELSGPLPVSLKNLTQLELFWYQDTNLCEPVDTAFQAWLDSISDVRSTGVVCGSSPTFPSAPTDLQVYPASSTEIRLTWTDTSRSETGFFIDEGSTSFTVNANTTTFIHSGLVPNSYHCYQVYAFNDYGNSPGMGWKCVTTPP